MTTLNEYHDDATVKKGSAVVDSGQVSAQFDLFSPDRCIKKLTR